MSRTTARKMEGGEMTMPKCDICGEPVVPIIYDRCKVCGRILCPNHTLMDDDGYTYCPGHSNE